MSDTTTGNPQLQAVAPQVVRDERPWGGFERFTHNQATTVKIITVKPGARLSLQYHHHRDELWVVLDEAMEVELNGERMVLKQGEQVFIPRTVHHRAIGLDKPCRWLEIAFGDFNEEDIIRVEDDYQRA